MKPLYVLLALLPSFLKIAIYNRFLGCRIDKTAKIGFSYVEAQKIVMGPYAKIGHLNMVKNLQLLDMGTYASIGNLNEFMAIPPGSRKHFTDETKRFSALKLGQHSSIVKGHFFDCNNTITIGDFSLLAGLGSAFFTHGIDIVDNRQRSAPVNIGHHCLISTKCVVVKGASLPDCSVLAANSTLHKAFTDAFGLYSGVPAKLVKTLPQDALFFQRQTGFVS